MFGAYRNCPQRVAAAPKRRQSHACATSPTQSHEAAAEAVGSGGGDVVIGNAAKPCARLATESRESAAGGQ